MSFDFKYLSESYFKAYDSYMNSIENPELPHWDYVILTSSNEFQSAVFYAQIEERRSSGFLHEKTEFMVIPDLDGKRVGSGGATLEVIRAIAEKEGKADFHNLRILVIHSGGDSKRVPQYSAIGKLFSPVPRKLKNGRNSTLFDEFLIAMAPVAEKIKEGMLLLSGDVLLLFDPEKIRFDGSGAAAISFKEQAEIGKNHGVFLHGERGLVKAFLHKQPVQVLTEKGAVDEAGDVNIDTGMLVFGSDVLQSLYRMVETDEIFHTYVNDRVRLSLYGDFQFPLTEEATLEDFYLEKPEGSFCPELTAARTVVWDLLHEYKMQLILLKPAKFIHFGTTGEVLNLMCGGVESYSSLGWSSSVGSSVPDGLASYNSVCRDQESIGNKVYLEKAYVHGGSSVGDNVVLSCVEVNHKNIPSGVVLHGLKQKDGMYVARIYGVSDNPKEGSIFGRNLEETAEKLHIQESQIWDPDAEHTLWNAKLYPLCNTAEEALTAALTVYSLLAGETSASDISEETEKWIACRRVSLCSGFNQAAPDAIIDWDLKMRELNQLTEFGNRIRYHYQRGKEFSGAEGEREVNTCFDIISETILEATIHNLKYNDKARIAMDRHSVSLPLRVNWGGGWSDTPPYCNENGGTVLNAAILLNGEKPVHAELERTDELKIVFGSRDMGVHGEFEEIEPLQQTGDPHDPFALQKACLLACGVIPKTGGDLKEILKRLGGGFIMKSEVTGVPKGSGLGTSSILSAACVKAVFEFMNIPHTVSDLYQHVLAMEQIMSTGGGWQDQVGGITEGIKFIETEPGLMQLIRVEQISLSEETMMKLNRRFALIYSGQNRLAKNLLRDVVGRYISGEPDSLYALNEIKQVAQKMRLALESGDIDAFAALLNTHWKLSRMIDAGSTNERIDAILDAVDDLVDGKFICGAGGGGFIQVILKDGVEKTALSERLKKYFADPAVAVWNAELI